MFKPGERPKRAAKIAESAQTVLPGSDEVREVLQVQFGRSAGANAASVAFASWGMIMPEKPVRSMALLVTDRELYAVSLKGARLLDVDEVLFSSPLSEADLSSRRTRSCGTVPACT